MKSDSDPSEEFQESTIFLQSLVTQGLNMFFLDKLGTRTPRGNVLQTRTPLYLGAVLLLKRLSRQQGNVRLVLRGVPLSGLEVWEKVGGTKGGA